MKVLIACEYSGIVREAFKVKGHNSWSCDILPTDKPGQHIQDNVLNILDQNWDLMIAHPPCTYLCNSGVSWLHKQPERWQLMEEGSLFFKILLESTIPKICIENPIQHKYAKEIIQQKYSQIIQPWMFGDAESKATCLWLKNLSPLVETNNVKDKMLELPINQRQRLHYLPPSKDRWKIRSRTFEGIANAMAGQWG